MKRLNISISFNGPLAVPPPPAIVLPGTVNSPYPISLAGLKDDFKNINAMFGSPGLIVDQKERTQQILSNLTEYSIGTAAYHDFYAYTILFVLEKGGQTGTDLVEKLQDKVPDTLQAKFKARNAIIPRLMDCGLFEADKTQFEQRYDTVSEILKTVKSNHQHQEQRDYADNFEDIARGLAIDTSSPAVEPKNPVIAFLRKALNKF